jgi:hypothetical protein
VLKALDKAANLNGVTMKAYRKWALEQVPHIEKTIKKGDYKKGNYLLNCPLTGIELFICHVSLYGWPDSTELLQEIVSTAINGGHGFEYITEELWGVELSCVIGSKECTNKDGSIDVGMKDPLTEEQEEIILEVLELIS